MGTPKRDGRPVRLMLSDDLYRRFRSASGHAGEAMSQAARRLCEEFVTRSETERQRSRSTSHDTSGRSGAR
jgi:hypothetical protein